MLCYTKDELYTLWRNFADDPNAIQILSDFIGRGDNRRQAKELIAEFEIMRETRSLDMELRGRADRIRKHF